MTATRKLLGIELYNRPQAPGTLYGRDVGPQGFSYTRHVLGTERTLSIIAKILFMPVNLGDFDVVITSEYFASFAVNLRLLLGRLKTKHVTIGLNQSRRLLRTGVRFIDALINLAFRRIDLTIVHSRQEAELFHQVHSIAKDKIHFSPWGFDLPAWRPGRFSAWPRPYVCMVGRNNRDFELFADVLDGMTIDGIIVASQTNAPREKLPANVHCFLDLGQDETFDCIKNALASLILLKDSNRGAGHITAVAGMFLEAPQIVSNAEVITDYFVDGASALFVPLHDPAAVRSAIERLVSDTATAEALRQNARRYADRWLTNERVFDRIMNALGRVARGEHVPAVDPDWLHERQRLVAAADQPRAPNSHA